MQGNAWSETTFQDTYCGTHHPTWPSCVARNTETEGRTVYLSWDGPGCNRSSLHVAIGMNEVLNMLNGAEAT